MTNSKHSYTVPKFPGGAGTDKYGAVAVQQSTVMFASPVMRTGLLSRQLLSVAGDNFCLPQGTGLSVTVLVELDTGAYVHSVTR